MWTPSPVKEWSCTPPVEEGWPRVAVRGVDEGVVAAVGKGRATAAAVVVEGSRHGHCRVGEGLKTPPLLSGREEREKIGGNNEGKSVFYSYGAKVLLWI